MLLMGISNRVTTFLKDKGLDFKDSDVVRFNSNDGSVVIRISTGELNYYVKGFTKRTIGDVRREIGFINVVSECGIIVPKLIYIDDEQVFSCYWENICIVFYVMTELVGDMLVENKTYVDIASRIAALHNMKDKFRCLEQLEGKSDHQHLVEFIKNNKDIVAELIDPEQINNMLVCHIPSYDFYLIHADLYMGNILARNGRFYGLIDFSDVKYGLLEDDFGKYLQNILTSQEDYSLAKEIVAIYKKKRTDRVDFKEILLSCIYRILYNYYCMYSNYKDEQLTGEIKERYRKAISFCIMEYGKYE